MNCEKSRNFHQNTLNSDSGSLLAYSATHENVAFRHWRNAIGVSTMLKWPVAKISIQVASFVVILWNWFCY